MHKSNMVGDTNDNACEDSPIYFQFDIRPGHLPEYRYTGGTQCVSETVGLETDDLLQYVFQHSSLTIHGKTNEKPRQEKDDIRGKALMEEGKASSNIQKLIEATMHFRESDDIKKIHTHIQNLMAIKGLSDYQLEEENKEESDLSDKLAVKYTPTQGRFVVAVEDIEVGESIISEKPLVSYLHKTHATSNCATCLRAVVFSWPCQDCSDVLFCSEICRKQGDSFHRKECGYSRLLPPSGPLCPVLRMFTSRSLEYFKQQKECFTLEANKPKGGGWLHYDEDIMEAAFQLQAGNKKSSLYRLEKAAWTAFMIHLLRRMNYFSASAAEGRHLDPDQLMIGRMVEHFLRVADDNCHEVCQAEAPTVKCSLADMVSVEGIMDQLVVVVGVAIYLKISLFNNSCDVNTIKCHRGSTEILRAKRNIQAGEEVSDFYGEYFFQADRLTRKKNLGFSCCCQACRENWPPLDQLPDFSEAEAAARPDWVDQRLALQSAADQLDLSATEASCHQLCRLSADLKRPHAAQIVCETYLSLAHMLLHGNRSLGFDLWLQKNS